MQSEPLLIKAERFIASAKVLIEESDFDSVASRLYYAMFFIAEALLQSLGLSYSSHRAVISAYGLHFAKTTELDPRFHKALVDAFNKRQLGDYAVVSGLNKDDIDILMANAIDFLAAAREWFAEHSIKGADSSSNSDSLTR